MCDVGSRYTVDTYKQLFMLQSWAQKAQSQNFFLTKLSLDVSALHMHYHQQLPFLFSKLTLAALLILSQFHNPRIFGISFSNKYSIK
jgi:hypothetical protein